MQKEITLRLIPAEAENHTIIKEYIAAAINQPAEYISGFSTLKRSIDARSRKQTWIQLTLLVYINEPFAERHRMPFEWKSVRSAKKQVIIIGAGPAGLFAALQLIELGIRPVILERGKNVRDRRRDLAKLNREGIVHPDSNYCFGEGGAGTYSDGKLYTRSNKRGNINRILQLFFQFGADEQILYEAHPHIGTNKLPQIITSMRETIIGLGGDIQFEQKVTDLLMNNDRAEGVITEKGDRFEGDAVILATGHSARDVFELLERKKILIEAKPFALGVRIEHPQSLIDSIQYHCVQRDHFLPPASYGLVEQVNERGVFSFCMCPGGIIAPAATSPGELVVNGWSPSKRNNPFANSGMVVQVELPDVKKYLTLHKINPSSPLAMMHFQSLVERAAFSAGGGKLVAPAQRMVDYCNNKHSTMLPDCSYVPGVKSYELQNLLPAFVHERLKAGLQQFGKKMKGYYTNEAILVATESRTSSPVKIPRDAISCMHPQIKNLFPCGEGAGYAGGIVSAAMDGEKIACQIAAIHGIKKESQK